MKQETTKTHLLNICPSWRGMANTCIMIMEVGNEEAQAVAKAEIRRMGAILDVHSITLDEEEDEEDPPPWLE